MRSNIHRWSPTSLVLAVSVATAVWLLAGLQMLSPTNVIASAALLSGTAWIVWTTFSNGQPPDTIGQVLYAAEQSAEPRAEASHR